MEREGLTEGSADGTSRLVVAGWRGWRRAWGIDYEMGDIL